MVVVARVQAKDVRELVRRLGAELERQHRLVSAKGVRRLDRDGKRLSLYRFQHNLFRSYLYNEMDEAEWMYLHEDVGRGLEELYGDQVEEIVVQLAWHYDQAGIVDKAVHYLQRAGKQATTRFANSEAIQYFSRALVLISEMEKSIPELELLEMRYQPLSEREEVLARIGNRSLQGEDLVALEGLVEFLADKNKRA